MMMIENFCDEIVVHFSESIFQVNKSDDNRVLFYACLVDRIDAIIEVCSRTPEIFGVTLFGFLFQ